MSNRRLLLLSNSTNFGEGYLEYPQKSIIQFLGTAVNEVLFIPYAGVGFSYDTYTAKVGVPLLEMGYKIKGIHEYLDKKQAILDAQAIAVGGGNTFELLNQLYQQEIINVIKQRVENGLPFIGWSAGSNIAGPSIKTTNDMPIVEPPSFDALNLVPFQINPHYTEERLPNHGGETRKDRLAEFMALNPDVNIIGVPEGNLLHVEQMSMKLIGEGTVKVFGSVSKIKEYTKVDDLSFLL